MTCIRRVLSVLLYGSETWTLSQPDWRWLDSFHTRCQRRILHMRMRWYDYISNDEVLCRTSLLTASSIVCKQRLGLFGHDARFPDDVLANQILRTCCEAAACHHQLEACLSSEAVGLAAGRSFCDKSQWWDAMAEHFASWMKINEWMGATKIVALWVSEQCFTSPPTQYRLYGRLFLQVTKDPTNSIKVLKGHI